MNTCTIDDCTGEVRARGYCGKHYKRWNVHGDPLVYNGWAPLEKRFWAGVDKSSECWIWTGHKYGNGYGTISGSGKSWLTHRLSYELAKGPIPEGLVIDHTCHVRLCCNPLHLRAVTQKQNLENHSGPQSNCKSGIRGVRQRTQGSWEARVHHRGTTHIVGYFPSADEAAVAVIAKRNELFSHNDHDRIAS